MPPIIEKACLSRCRGSFLANCFCRKGAEVGRTLAMAVTSLANVLNPRAVVLGGYFAHVAEWLVPRIEHELAAHALAARWSPCDVLVSTLGEEAAVHGAASLALQDVLANPARITSRSAAAL